jgi:putative hydrolase of the HAD superfamily
MLPAMQKPESQEKLLRFMPTQLQAISFDYGNTLIRFGHAELERLDNAVIALLERECGPVDRQRYLELRRADRIRPYEDEHRENRLPDIFAAHVRELFQREADAALLEAIGQAWLDAFVDAIEPLPWSADVLMRVRRRYKIAVLSNYPSGAAIRASLDRVGLADMIDVVVTSADVGYVKPHRAAFDAVLDSLGVQAEQTLHVGDHWLADVQGAKRAGLWACHLTQYEPPERFDPQPGDVSPDLTLAHLEELPAVLDV